MKIILAEEDIRRIIIRITHEIIEKNKGIKNIVLIGIKRRGDFIAQRIAEQIRKSEGKKIPIGAVDINLYRDDLQLVAEAPIIEGTDIPFDINSKTVILVDDVLFTGRTVRAAIEEILDFGRPRVIQLAVLIDRGHRELPIQAEYVGKKLPTSRNEIVDVLLKESDGGDQVVLHQKGRKKEASPKARSRITIAAPARPKIRQLTITDKNEP
jgi:pyrimidine operon attenuation protein/uracil phosphoribosyltransferase